MLALIKREPAVFIGAVAAAILAAVQSLGGHGILSGDVVQWFSNALNPSSGWAIPLIVGVITRQFVSPASSSGQG